MHAAETNVYSATIGAVRNTSIARNHGRVEALARLDFTTTARQSRDECRRARNANDVAATRCAHRWSAQQKPSAPPPQGARYTHCVHIHRPRLRCCTRDAGGISYARLTHANRGYPRIIKSSHSAAPLPRAARALVPSLIEIVTPTTWADWLSPHARGRRQGRRASWRLCQALTCQKTPRSARDVTEAARLGAA